MFDMLPRRPSSTRMLGVAPAAMSDAARPVGVSNVVAVEGTSRRWRAVVTRSVQQTAVVEFDAPDTADRWQLAKEVAAKIPDEAWQAGQPCDPYIQDMDVV